MGKYSLKRMPYPSDVTDEEWEILEPLIPGAKPDGRPQEIERREILNAILYVLRSGCPWRLLPHDLPRWFTAYWYFRQWKRAGIWEQVNAALRRDLRVQMGREPEPSAAILDSQSIKSSSVRGDKRGYDGGKKTVRAKAPTEREMIHSKKRADVPLKRRREPMKTAKKLENVIKRFYRPEQQSCPECQRRLRRAVTLSERTIITLQEVVKVIHAGYRCPDPTCSAHLRTYRSSRADALALPGFTFGLDVVLLVGHLHLGEHRTVDETHRGVVEQLAPLGTSVSRREILYLFDAYCTLLRVGTEAKEDKGWLEQVEQNGGIIVSMDGIQPDKGNETIYLVRDALSGRVLSAANVTFSGIANLKELLTPVTTLGVPVLGTISDAQEPLLKALEQTWPEVPHQICQFHALRDAARPAFEQDRKLKTQMRKYLHPRLKDVREEIRRELPKAEAKAAEQLAVLDDYALGMQAALHFDGLLPFDYPGLASAEAFEEVATSLEQVEKKGGH